MDWSFTAGGKTCDRGATIVDGIAITGAPRTMLSRRVLPIQERLRNTCKRGPPPN